MNLCGTTCGLVVDFDIRDFQMIVRMRNHVNGFMTFFSNWRKTLIYVQKCTTIDNNRNVTMYLLNTV